MFNHGYTVSGYTYRFRELSNSLMLGPHSWKFSFIRSGMRPSRTLYPTITMARDSCRLQSTEFQP